MIDAENGLTLEEAEAAFIAAARRLDRMRENLGLRPLGLEDLPTVEHLATGLGDRSEGEDERQSQTDGDADPALHGVPPEWRALMDEARAFEAWYAPSRLGINAWVGVDTISGLYGGWSADGDQIYDWDESNMMTAEGATPADVIADLIRIARQYREQIDKQHEEDELDADPGTST